jgi:ribonuclease HI
MKLVKRGVRWSVGDGNKIDVLTDYWIPNVRPETLHTLTPLPDGTTVSFLLAEDHRSWDVDVVRSVFEEDVANRVLEIPISRRGGDDFLSWPLTKYGEYTVRSAYHLARNEKFFLDQSKKGRGSHSALQDDSAYWKKLCAIKAPGKMKINIWRFAHDCLPSGSQLVRRHIPASAACSVCGREETAAHCFLFCQYAKEFWRVIKHLYGFHLRRKSFVCSKSWVFDFLSRSTDRERMVLVVGVWHLWTARNSVRNGEPSRHPHSVAEQCKAYVEMIELQLFKPGSSSRREAVSLPRWSPPPEGMAYINVDAALFPPSRRMGIGIVIRNHMGECSVACSELGMEVTVPEVAEALAVRRALSLAETEGFDKVIVASDCLSLIQRLIGSENDRSSVGVVVQDIKAQASGFSSVSFVHVYRQCNVAAHTLARSAEHFISVIFRNSIPDCIRQTLCNGLY